ncbi:DNA repair protein RadC [Ideonella azotifigens]|uniref:DNA repair protein RadC n=1 Tax=Ideonella azotifigens TaxID=513160 RepID=A0ABN1JH98_9BURK|nr:MULTISPECIES: DNA repair protein RadC [Ideonella]MCD2344684.1 DNA repair protein RadC [Ideonella azotifigens]HSI51902.1 DNA repair protein RadC [Ideonella sp.]
MSSTVQSSAQFGLFTALLVQEPDGHHRAAKPEEVLHEARQVLSQWIRRGPELTSPQEVREYLSLQIGLLEHEVFAILFLDSQHRVLACKEMFRGTVSQTSVYPREVVKEALALNAAAVILAHNHPSGLAEPSRADEAVTSGLKAALALVDVRVLDHLVVAGAAAVSFAERGLL